MQPSSAQVESNIQIDSAENSVQQLRIGEMLTMLSKMKSNDVERVLAYQKERNVLFGSAAISLGIINQNDLRQILSEQFQFPYINESENGFDKSLVTALQPDSFEAELYRSMRSQLLLRWFEKGNKLLSIVSTCPDDQSYRLAANLAVVFAQMNKRTLLIDANLRERNQSRMFKLNDALGLTNILGNRQGKYEFYKHETLKNLSVLPAGTEVPNPQELLMQGSFVTLLEELKPLYDVILIDTTPMSLGLDMQTVVAKTKGAVITVRRNITYMSMLKEMQSKLSTAEAVLLGSALID